MKKIVWLFFLFFPSYIFAVDSEVKPDECASPKECISKLYQVVDRSRPPAQAPSVKEEAIIIRLLEFGDEAMPFIIKLLDEDDKLIARVGAVALGDAKSIDVKYLPYIIKGLEKDVHWLPPALAKVGTPEAAEVAVKKYISSDRPRNLEDLAISHFGRKALPVILKAVKCEFGCNEDTFYMLGILFEQMKEYREEAAKMLIELAEDKSEKEYVRRGAIVVISYLEEPALIVENNLVKIKADEPKFSESVDEALIGMKSKYAGKIYAEILDYSFDVATFVDISKLGVNGYDAGPAVTQLLNEDDIEIQVAAARALGYIEYTPAVPKLIQLLNARTSVQLNWSAAESLGRIKSKLAIPELQATAKSHWYQPVRDAARRAIKRIEADKNAGNESPQTTDDDFFWKFSHFDMQNCKGITLAKKEESKDKKLYKSYAKELLESLSYPSVIYSYGPDDEEAQKAANPDGVIVVNSRNIVRHEHKLTQVPDVALRIDGGWLAGSNRGEWGGDLVYINDDKKSTKIMESNDIVEDIYKLGDRYIATTGTTHLGLNSAMVFELFQGADGSWKAKQWLMLPGAPMSSWLVETGELLINTNSGGSILLSKDGVMRMAECTK